MTRAMSELIPPAGGRSVWKIRFKPPGYRKPVKLSARTTKKSTADRFRVRVDCLIEDRVNGDPPRAELAPWIEALDPATARRLIELGLLDRPRFEQARPLMSPPDAAGDPARRGHVDDYGQAVAARNQNSPMHARRMAGYVRRVCKQLNVEYFPQLNRHDVEVLISQWKLAPNAARHYLLAMRDFAAWMKRDKRATTNPLADLRIPQPQKEGTIRRRAMGVEEFRALVAHLDRLSRKGGYYAEQRAGWDAADRKMVYWTAVCTAYRQDELRSLRRYQLRLEEAPPAIEIRAEDAKNGRAASVPIPTDLAGALTTYCQTLHPASKVFPIPPSRRRVMEFWRKDLAAARKAWIETKGLDPKERKKRRESAFLLDEHPSGRLDFHALRHTAITWWLDLYGLSPKKVQILARLETLALVENYSRAMRTVDNFDYLARAPQLVTPPAARVRTA